MFTAKFWRMVIVTVLLIALVGFGAFSIISGNLWKWIGGTKSTSPTAVAVANQPQIVVATATPKPQQIVNTPVQPTEKPTQAPGATMMPLKPTNTPAPGVTTVAPTAALKKVQVGLVVFAPYSTMIGATKYAEQWGIEIEIVNLTGLEAQQCDWVKGKFDPPPVPELVAGRILLTTHNSARMCEGVAIPLVIGQSAGTDKIIVKPDIKNWDQIFDAPVVGTGFCSVSQYYIDTFAWALGKNLPNWIPADDAEPALEQWKKDQTIKSLVVWEPYGGMALEAVPGSWVALSSERWAGIFDVAVIKKDSNINDSIYSVLAAYMRFLKLEMEDANSAWNYLVEWEAKHSEMGALGYDNKEDFFADLAGEAQATLDNNISLFLVDTGVLVRRLQEAEEVLTSFPCKDDSGKPIALPKVNPLQMLDSRYVERMKSEASLQTKATPLNVNIRLTTSLPLAEAISGSEKIVATLPSAYIEFMPDSADYKAETAAKETIEKKFVSVLRLTDNTVLYLKGGYAMPGGCQGCTDAGGVEWAIKRAEKVRQTIIHQYNIPETRVKLTKDVRPPKYRDSFDQNLVREDRRVEATLVTVGGQ